MAKFKKLAIAVFALAASACLAVGFSACGGDNTGGTGTDTETSAGTGSETGTGTETGTGAGSETGTGEEEDTAATYTVTATEWATILGSVTNFKCVQTASATGRDGIQIDVTDTVYVTSDKFKEDFARVKQGQTIYSYCDIYTDGYMYEYEDADNYWVKEEYSYTSQNIAENLSYVTMFAADGFYGDLFSFDTTASEYVCASYTSGSTTITDIKIKFTDGALVSVSYNYGTRFATFTDFGTTVVEVPSQDEVHIHTYSDTWTYDLWNHWHAATCSHTSITKGEENHTYENGSCSVCGIKEIIGSTCQKLTKSATGWVSCRKTESTTVADSLLDIGVNSVVYRSIDESIINIYNYTTVDDSTITYTISGTTYYAKLDGHIVWLFTSSDVSDCSKAMAVYYWFTEYKQNSDGASEAVISDDDKTKITTALGDGVISTQTEE